MHILYLQQLLVLPGKPGTQRSWEMATAWKQAGHKVSFISSTALLEQKESDPFYQRKEVEGIDLHLLDIPYSHFMPFRERLTAFYRFYKEAFKLKNELSEVDIVLAYSAPLSTAFLGRKLAMQLKAPFVFEAADVWPDVPIGMGIIKNPILKFFLQSQTKKLYRAASAICTFTEDMREQIQSHGISENDVKVIHNGVNLSRFGQRKAPTSEQLKIVYVGSLGMANGLSQLLYAWKLIEKKWSSNKVSLHIVGEGNEGDMLKALAKELGLTSLHFHPVLPQDEVGDFLADADIGLVCIAPYPVLEANGSTKAFEYMAAGIPMVLNYEGWLANYLKTYNCGLAAPLGHVESFARQINQLILNPEKRQEMGRNARRLAEERFDRTKLAEQMLEIFESLQTFV